MAKKAEQAVVRVNKLTGIRVDQLSREPMLSALHKLHDASGGQEKEPFPKWAKAFLGSKHEEMDDDQLATAICFALKRPDSARFGKMLGPCDVCGGESPDSLPVCPYCGTEDTEGDVAPPKLQVVSATPPTAPREEVAQAAVPAPAAEVEPVAPAAEVEAPAPKAEKKTKAKDKAAKPEPVKTDALAVVEAKAELMTSSTLDELRDEINAGVLAIEQHRASAGRSLYQIGVALKRVREQRLYELRVDPAGKRTYKTFEAWCLAEVGHTATDCHAKIKLVEQFDAPAVEKHGLKLVMVARVPDSMPELRAEAIAALEDGKTKREVGQIIHDAKRKVDKVQQTDAKGVTRTLSTSHGSKGGSARASSAQPREQRITVSSILGKYTLPAYQAASVSKRKPEAEWKRAKKAHLDAAVGVLEMENGVRCEVRTHLNAAGLAEFKFEFKREE